MENSEMTSRIVLTALIVFLSVISATSSTEIYCESFSVLQIDACNSKLILDRSATTKLRSGTIVALHCSQSTSANGDSLTGTITLCSVDTATGNSVYLREDVGGIAASLNRVQLVVPLLGDAVLGSDTIRPLPWNGRFGGAVIILGGHIDLRDITVDASARGFLGGQQTFPYVSQTDTTDELARRTSGECYLGVMRMHAGQFGILHNGGGSGASTRALGGRGGSTSSAFQPVMSGSIPGAPWDRPILVFGSGGGAGHRNDLSSAGGGRGGGLIVIIADSISTSNRTILDVSGEHGQAAVADGAGGGGAGGTIALAVTRGLNKLSLRGTGGNGGDVFCSTITAGPGGGAAGGTVYTESALSDIRNVNLRSGMSGRIRCADSSSHANGAGNGRDGMYVLVSSLVTTAPMRASPSVRIRAVDTIVDYGSTTLLELTGEGVVTWENPTVLYRSSDRRLVETPAITQPVWFAVTVITPSGCAIRDSIRIRPKLDAVSITIEADYIRAAPGDTVDVFLRMTLSSPLQRTVQGTISISTNAAVAHGVGGTHSRNGRATLHVPFVVNSGATTTFRRQQLAITLGDSLTSQISIDSVALSGPTIPVRRRHGRITLDSICVAGGRPRLFDPYAPSLQIVGRMIIAQADDVALFDLLGRSITGVVSRDANAIVAHIPEDIHGLVLISITAHGRVWSRSIWLD